jgi:hypothetical protein
MTWSFTLLDSQPQWFGLFFLSLLILSAGFSVYFSFKRIGQGHVWRKLSVMFLNLMAGFALLGLLADINLSEKNIQQAWLITDGAVPLSEQLQSQFDALQDNQRFVFAPASDLFRTPKLSDKPVRFIEQAEQLLDWQPELQQLTVLGEGLNHKQWQTLLAQRPNLKIHYNGAIPLSGLVDMNWSHKAVVGQYFDISGRIQVAASEQNTTDLYQLELIDPMQRVLQTISLRSNEAFHFTEQTKLVGNWQYTLRLTQKDHLSTDNVPIANEVVAVSVEPGIIVPLLIYQSAPSFETRHLKAWATSFNNPVTVISQISKNKYLTQQYNNPVTGSSTAIFDAFNLETLTDYSLLVMDGRAFSELNNEQQRALKQAIEQGLGILILADQGLATTMQQSAIELLTGWQLHTVDAQNANQRVLPQWPSSILHQAIQIPNLQLNMRAGQTLVGTTNQQILVGVRPLGLGHVAVSLINNTFQWQTSGNAAMYSQYWQYLFSKIARYQGQGYWLAKTPASLTMVNQLDTVCALSADPSIEASFQTVGKTDFIPLKLTMDSIQQSKFCATWWPASLGWQQLNLSKNTTNGTSVDGQKATINIQQRFVYGSNDWLAWQQQNKIQASTFQAKRSEKLSLTEPQTQRKAVNKLWCWMFFILSCSLLWIERKLF